MSHLPVNIAKKLQMSGFGEATEFSSDISHGNNDPSNKFRFSQF